MKLRIAKKIVASIGTEREGAYSEGKLNKALDRIDRTRTHRENQDFFNWLIGEAMTVEDRARILNKTGAPEMALSLLMRTRQEDWVKSAKQIMEQP